MSILLSERIRLDKLGKEPLPVIINQFPILRKDTAEVRANKAKIQKALPVE
jgi:hypothetical protein